METNSTQILLVTGLMILTSCGNRNPAETTETVSDSSVSHVTLSSAQIEYAGIEISSLKKHFIADAIECNGNIEADPNEEALVSPPLKGYLNKICIHVGEFVNKGDILAVLQHPEYVNLQQEYLEVLSQYEYYKEDFKRQGELSLENAASLKTMQQAQNEYRKIEVRLFALKKHLAFLGINADSLTVETIHAEIVLTSPVSGYVTRINGAIGKLCTEEIPVFNIVGTKSSLLHLNVYEKDAGKVSIGQDIKFSLVSEPQTDYRARVTAVARAVDDNKTVSVHASILERSKSLMPGMFVKASIFVDSDSVLAINEEAIVSQSGKQYLFVKIDSTSFDPISVDVGRTSGNMTEILRADKKLTDSKIVIAGAYYLLSEYMKEE
jgi:cobalt-zinc-cadmium efflux system membrane fusion protein